MRIAWACLFTAAALTAAPVPVDSGEWDAVRGTATLDQAVQRDGRASLRVETSVADAFIRSAPVSLVVGRNYELSGWVRAENLRISDLDRSPIAIGATLAMASMPFDVHSESVSGTRAWTRLSLRFTATRSTDAITLRVAEGGAFTGRVWFDSISLDNAASSGFVPPNGSVKRFGPAYRYPKAGWIYLHIEGEPYERGYQHGQLMAKEIEEYLDRCAAEIGPGPHKDAWEHGRTLTNASFLRGFDEEILAEMRGIADGAKAAGCKYNGREVDLIDIATANVTVELGELRQALGVTRTGLEMLGFKPPVYAERKGSGPAKDRCSAFAATGKATRDGHMVIAHTTWWSMTLAEQTNVWLDIQPKNGHRVLMQSYPGGIESGTDWYQNDAGVVLTETTIRQTPFDPEGTPVAFRARRAIQYGGNVDEVVQHLGSRNNGLYSNEWLIGDGKNDEIAMFELGTRKTRLWRSSKDEWFAGTEGFYWGNNNAKDLAVRLEAIPHGSTEHVPYSPAYRDVKWLELFDRYKGQIDEQLAFLAFRTGPLVSWAAMDGKVATAEMARNLMVWGAIGRPNQREWLPNDWARKQYEKNDGMYPAGYALFDGKEPEFGTPEETKAAEAKSPPPTIAADRLWQGVILPAADADTWLTTGGQRYRAALVSGQHGMDVLRADYAFAAASVPEFSLRDTAIDVRSRAWMIMASRKGALLLDALRARMGDDRFFPFMKSFYEQNADKAVSMALFRAAAEKVYGQSLAAFFSEWIDRPALPGGVSAARYPGLIVEHLSSALIVYGTTREAGSNRYAAEQLREKFLDWCEHAIPIRKDFEVTDAEIASHDVIFVGRPETNSALAALTPKLALQYDGAGFRAGGGPYPYDTDALVWAAMNPLEPRRLTIVVAGNSPLQTVKAAREFPEDEQWNVSRNGQLIASGFGSGK